MDIIFYKLEKVQNSTKRPYSTTEFRKETGAILPNTSITSPSISVKASATDNQIFLFNYALIEDFDDRYYFVRNWRWQSGYWIADMEVDVLATYKTSIGDSTQFVIRSASDENKNIPDAHTISGPLTTVRLSAGTPFYNKWKQDFFVSATERPHYILAAPAQLVTLRDGSTEPFSDGMYYFCGSYVALQSLILEFSMGWPSLTDAAQQLKFFKFSPMEIDTYPLNFDNGGVINKAVKKIQMSGSVVINLSTTTDKFNSVFLAGYTKRYSKEKWSFAAVQSEYTWTNAEPFKEYEIQFEPIGKFLLPSNLLCDVTSFEISARCDVLTGETEFYLDVESGSSFQNLMRISNTQIELPIFTSQVLGGTKILNLPQESLVTVAASQKNAEFSTAVAMAGFGTKLANSALSIASQTGINVNGGTQSMFVDAVPILRELSHIKFKTDAIRDGRPLMATRQIKTLTGYVQCADVKYDTSFVCLADEATKIKAYMEGGFFYE